MSLEKKQRIDSIDLVRGIVIVLMTLDHTRDFFHKDAFNLNPVNLSETTPALFFTRWITHYCAPIFIFLAGTSAFLYGHKRTKKSLSIFLLSRGVFLIILEITLITFAWHFDDFGTRWSLGVIWAIGCCMVFLAGAIWLPMPAILTLGLSIVLGHNLLDYTGVDWSQSPLHAIVHSQSRFQLSGLYLSVIYPLTPWIGVILIGYVSGTFYMNKASGERKKALLQLGLASLLLFVVIRFSNFYGDPRAYDPSVEGVWAVMSLVNTTKYPASLHYLLMTLGPLLILLSLLDQVKCSKNNLLTTLGTTSLFYYTLHLYLLHLLAFAAVLLTGYKINFDTDMYLGLPAGYGFSLPIVYLVAFVVVALLYPLCLIYKRYKKRHPEKWWLSYF